jgi:hypothetical protein
MSELWKKETDFCGKYTIWLLNYISDIRVPIFYRPAIRCLFYSGSSPDLKTGDAFADEQTSSGNFTGWRLSQAGLSRAPPPSGTVSL